MITILKEIINQYFDKSGYKPANPHSALHVYLCFSNNKACSNTILILSFVKPLLHPLHRIPPLISADDVKKHVKSVWLEV